MLRIRTILLPILLTVLGQASAHAQAVAIDTRADGTQVTFNADKMDYSGDLRVVTLRGNVRIQRGVEILQANEITYNQDTKDAAARGSVSYENGVDTWRGEALDYNFDTRTGNFGTTTFGRDPIHVTSARSQQLGPDHFRLEDVTITTCDPNDMEAWMEAGRADIYEKRIVKARNVVFYHQGIPFLYLPSYTLDLDREPTHFDVLPGYSSRNGPYVLTGYTVPFDAENDLRSVTHLDYRAERGPGIGQDLKWRDLPDQKWNGFATGYFAQDDKPYRSADEETRKRAQFIDKDEERYRLRLQHNQNFDSGDALYLESGYLSDPEVVQDFFDDEFRLFPEQENRLSYSHSEAHYSAGLELSHQFNDDFYDSVNRQPEAFLNFNRTRIPGTDLYYQSQNSASVLERTYGERSRSKGLEDYDTQRIHTSHTLFYPTKNFGWLNLTPRAGYAATYYGDTIEPVTASKVTSSVSTNGVTTFTTNTVSDVANLGADMRSLFEIGFETSFKAFRVLHDDPLTNDGVGLRHVVEPYANYTLVPEPDLLPENLYQFDSIDRLDKRNDILFGVRNKLQTRHVHPEGNEVVDLIDFNIYTSYLLDPDEDEDSLSDVYSDTDIHFSRAFSLRFDNRYNVEEGEFTQFNSRASLRAEDRSFLALDHRYRPDTRNLLQLSYSVVPEAKFSVSGLTRYDFESSEMEEQQVMLNWKRKCVGYGIGGKWIAGDFASDGSQGEDDYQIWGQIWLTAFPRSRLDVGR